MAIISIIDYIIRSDFSPTEMSAGSGVRQAFAVVLVLATLASHQVLGYLSVSL